MPSPSFQEAVEVKSSGALGWFEDDGSAWAVQGVGLDVATLVAIAESLTDYQG
jgi:hypothetical protein